MKTHGIKFRQRKKTLASILAEFSRQSLKQKIYTIVCTFLIVIIQTVIFFPSLLFTIDFPFKFITWGSKLGHFSMNSPINWIPTELSYGNHGDMEVIAVILPIGQSLPRVEVALKEFPSRNISDVASWGEQRIIQDGQYLSNKLGNITTQYFSGLIREYIVEVIGISRTKIHCFDIYTLYNEVGYQFSFCAEEKDWLKIHDMFLKMIQSISFFP